MKLFSIYTLSIIVFLASFCTIANGQTKGGGGDGDTEDLLTISVLPPSPNAASLAQYAEVSTGLTTGAVSPSIPIYNLQSRDISLPISLNYHGGGIRVTQTASWVGLGWSLNAGGAITRSVRVLPDEKFPHGYWNAIDNLGQIAQKDYVDLGQPYQN